MYVCTYKAFFSFLIQQINKPCGAEQKLCHICHKNLWALECSGCAPSKPTQKVTLLSWRWAWDLSGARRQCLILSGFSIQRSKCVCDRSSAEKLILCLKCQSAIWAPFWPFGLAAAAAAALLGLYARICSGSFTHTDDRQDCEKAKGLLMPRSAIVELARPVAHHHHHWQGRPLPAKKGQM